MLFQFFAQSQFRPPEITEDDVARFVADNPGLFGGCRSYRHAEITIAGGSDATRAAALARIETTMDTSPSVADLDALVAGLSGNGLSVSMATAWVPSEVLPEALRARLEAMVTAGRRIDAAREEGRVSVIMLFAAVPIPADPARLRGRIEQQLLAQAFAAHREALIADLSRKVLEQPDAPETSIEPSEAAREVGLPPRGSVVWSSQPSVPRNIRLVALYAAVFLGALAILALWSWLRLVMVQDPLVRRLRLMVPVLRRRRVAITVPVIGGVGLAVGLAATASVALRTLGETTSLVIATGGVVIALALSTVWRARRAFDAALETARDDHDDDIARELVILNTGSEKYLALGSVPVSLAAGWIVMRLIGFSVVVPVLEEPAFRGGLYRLVSGWVAPVAGPRAAALAAFVLTSLAFGAMHSDMLAGTLAGAGFALLVLRTGRVADAIIAHAVTNFLLAMTAMATGHWSLW